MNYFYSDFKILLQTIYEEQKKKGIPYIKFKFLPKEYKRKIFEYYKKDYKKWKDNNE